MSDLSNLEEDVSACLTFLIANQKEWQPEISLFQVRGQEYVMPVTLIGITDDGEIVVPRLT